MCSSDLAHYAESWKLPEVGSGTILFASAGGEVSINLHTGMVDASASVSAPEKTKTYAYSITLGAEGGTKTTLNRDKKDEMLPLSPPVAEVTTAQNPGAAGTAGTYWLSYINGEILFGSGETPGVNIILSWKDEEPSHTVEYFSFSERVEFTDIKAVDPTTLAAGSLGAASGSVSEDGASYTAVNLMNDFQVWSDSWKLPVVNQGTILFEAKTAPSNDEKSIVVGFKDPNPDLSTASHSVIIGGWRNTRSAIQKGAESVSYNVTPSAQVPGDDQFHPYWISVDGTTISYGKGAVPNMNMIGTWTSPDTLNISQFSLSSYSNVTEYRNIKVVELDDPTAHKVEANTNGQFTIWKPKWKLPGRGKT